MRTVLHFAALVIGAALANSSSAAETCPVSMTAVAAFPGPKTGAWYSEARRELPANPGCLDPREIDGCQVRGASGYLYIFGQMEEVRDRSGRVIRRQDRWLYQRTATPDWVARPPLGIRWSDSEAVIRKKLAALGLVLKPLSIARGPAHTRSASACFSRSNGDTRWFSFEFKAGKLIEISDVAQYT